MDLFVADLNRDLDETLLNKLFSTFGEVNKVTIVRNQITNESKCFGFITMNNALEAQRAINELNGKVIAGRKIVVKESKNNSNTKENKPTNRVEKNREIDNSEPYINDEMTNVDKFPVNVINKANYETLPDGDFVTIKFSEN